MRSKHNPVIVALYRATEDPETLAQCDAFTLSVRNAALRGIISERGELAACPPRKRDGCKATAPSSGAKSAAPPSTARATRRSAPP